MTPLVFPVTARLCEVRAPTLVLSSDADPVSPLAVGRFLVERIPGARLEVVRGGTHGFAEERPEEVARAPTSRLSPRGPPLSRG